MPAEYLRRGQGRSDRAEEAEARGLMPCTRAAKELRVPPAFVRDCCDSTEWHHVGKYASECDYYDVGRLRDALATDAGRAVLAAWRAWQRAKRRAATAGKAAREAGSVHSTLPRSEFERLAGVHESARREEYAAWESVGKAAGYDWRTPPR